MIDRDTNGEIPRDGNGNRLSRCAQRAQGQPSRLLAPMWRSAGAEHGCSGDSGHMVSAPSGQLALFLTLEIASDVDQITFWNRGACCARSLHTHKAAPQWGLESPGSQ